MTRLLVTRGGRRMLVIVGCAVLPLGAPATAGAHAALETATPASGVALKAAPRTVKLVFDEEVVPRLAQVTVVGARGQQLAGSPTVAGSVVTVPVEASRPGSYTVRWRMVASDDGHATEGAYSYGVGVKPLPPAPASRVGIPIAPELLAWLEFVGIVLTGGLLTFRALVRPRQSADVRGAREGTVALWAGVVGAVLGLHAGLLAFLTGAYPTVGGGLSAFVNTEIEPIRVGTHLGQAWTVTTFAWLGVLTLLVAAWVTPARRERLLGWAGVLALGIAFGISWASHPSARGVPALFADYLHLLAGALWVGGLISLAILTADARRLSSSARETLIRVSLLRLSAIAVPVVVVVGLAGAYLALSELPAPSALLSSGYGVTLIAKTVLAVGAVGVGGYHRRFVVPRIVSGAPVVTLRRTLVLEVGLLIAVLALAALLSQTAPPA